MSHENKNFPPNDITITGDPEFDSRFSAAQELLSQASDRKTASDNINTSHAELRIHGGAVGSELQRSGMDTEHAGMMRDIERARVAKALRGSRIRRLVNNVFRKFQ